ncbi:hypothetical protein HDV03_003743 [Kappamyces sp. JEL0829]|nr:hypothetical protein HDV03_003743 [Kappamyces sp. JEL0829]
MGRQDEDITASISADGRTVAIGARHKKVVEKLKRALDPSQVWTPAREWKRHAHASNLLLLRGHREFRRIARELHQEWSDVQVDQASWDKTRLRIRTSRMKLEAWHDGMNRGHEAYEEAKLYPFLEARFPGLELAYLSEEHDELHRYRDAVFACLTELETCSQGKEAARSRLVQAMGDYDLQLLVHLKEEEEIVCPLLLLLSLDEMQEFLDSPLTVLLRKLRKNSKRV